MPGSESHAPIKRPLSKSTDVIQDLIVRSIASAVRGNFLLLFEEQIWFGLWVPLLRTSPLDVQLQQWQLIDPHSDARRFVVSKEAWTCKLLARVDLGGQMNEFLSLCDLLARVHNHTKRSESSECAGKGASYRDGLMMVIYFLVL